jgi:glycosyltransferase involved in cell wall biosynthesis
MVGAMPRVLLTGFCAVPGPRRAGVQMRHVVRSLTSHNSLDLLVAREGEQPYVERQGSVRVLRVPTHDADARSQIQAFQRALKRQLDGADYDVVHCRDSWSGIPVLEARARFGYAVVYDLTRSPLGETANDPELDAQYGRDEEACLLAADLVLAPTPTAVKALQRRGRPERVVLAPPGVDVDRFDWEDAPPPGPPRILYTGSIDPGRGVRVLIRAMTSILRETDARLVIAGTFVTAKFETALRDGIRELGLGDRIELLGPVDHEQLPTLISTATVCVVPAAADITPNPTVVYPTKILEYMACRRAIVAPRRETVQMVVENNREALLFEPGDPIDLARKVLRLLGEEPLRAKLAQNAYERVRRDFTASATRRALRTAYNLLAQRFSIAAAAEDEDDAPKIEMLDDDFEATVFEEAPQPPPTDTGLNRISNPEALDEALAALDGADQTASGDLRAAPREADETMERAAVPARADDRDSGAWTVSAVKPRQASSADDWVVTTIAGAVAPSRRDSSHDDGTPVEGLPQAPHAVVPPPAQENAFVAGEIDVPTPPPEGGKTPKVEFEAASALLGNAEPADPDTGSRTPPIERR